MAELDGGYRREGEEEEEEEMELDANSYKTQKDAILIAIDVSTSMLTRPDAGAGAGASMKADRDDAVAAALKCTYQLMEQRIISNPKDMMGVLFFGTAQSKFQSPQDGGGGGGGHGSSYPHCYLFVDLDVPAARDVKAVKTLAEAGEAGRASEGVLVPAAGEPVSMSNVLFCANQIFTTNAANFGSRRLFIITDNDNPHGNDKQKKAAAAVRAKDLFDLGVVIEIFPIARGHATFDLAKFYDDIIYRHDTAEANLSEVRTSKSGDGLTLLSSLISNINSKQTAKRSLFSNLPLEIAPGLTISVNGYNVIHRQQPQRSCYIWLDGDKPQIAVGETTRMAEDTARTVEKGETKKAYKFGGEYIYFTVEEQKALRDFGKPCVRIIGFKPRGSIPVWASVKKSIFIFPSEIDYVGSTRVFAALWQKLLQDDRVGIGWCVTRTNANPRMVAIMASREGTDEESGTPYLPAGLWLYPLPFADDVREMPERGGGAVVEASDGLKSKMRTIVQQLQLPKALYNPKKYANPSLQWHYRILQALALEEEVPEQADDATEPKYRAISKRAGGYMEEWAQAVQQEASNTALVSRLKREADGLGQADDERPAKKGKLEPAAGKGPTDEQVLAAVDSGSVKMTVAALKDVLTVRGLSTAGKKQDFLDRLEEWAEKKRG